MNIKEAIFRFLSSHEANVAHDIRKKNKFSEVTFTRFGSRAGCEAIYDIIEILDEETKIKVLEMMRTKQFK